MEGTRLRRQNLCLCSLCPALGKLETAVQVNFGASEAAAHSPTWHAIPYNEFVSVVVNL